MKKWLVRIAWTGAALVAAGGALVAYHVVTFVLVAYGAIAPWNIGNFCIADTSLKSANVGGFDFEFEDTNCDVFGSQQIMLVFVSRHGQHQRHVLAAYAAISETPTATLVAPRTARLSLDKIEGFYAKEDSWRELQVVYDFSIAKFPRISQEQSAKP